MMYWTDWGSTPKIARGRLDNYFNVDTMVTGQLKWPSGLVIDAASRKLFWADTGMDRIEYSNLEVRSVCVCEAEHSTNQLMLPSI